MTDTYIRHTIVDQLTYDPNWGATGSLATDGAVILAWGSGSLLPVDIVGQKARATGNVLYYLPADVAVHGKTTFRGDLLRSSTIDASAAFFNKDPFNINFGKGSATIAYRPIPFGGTFAPTELAMGMNFGGDMPAIPPVKTLEPLPAIPEPCADPPTPDCTLAGFDGLPEVELFDLVAGDWVRLPHLAGGARYAHLGADPLRRPDLGQRRGQVRQRPERRRRLQLRPVHDGERPMTADPADRGPGQAVRRHAGRGRRRPVRRGRRDLRAGRAQRRRQDHDPAHAGHAPPAVGRGGRDRRAGP